MSMPNRTAALSAYAGVRDLLAALGRAARRRRRTAAHAAQRAERAHRDQRPAAPRWCRGRRPDRGGRMGEVLLGYDTPRQYLESNTYMGAPVGRWANRIAGARFTLDGIDVPARPQRGPQSVARRGERLSSGHLGGCQKTTARS